MRYLFLMFYKYYLNGKETNSIAYISALGVVGLYVLLLILNLCKLFNIDFTIPFWGKEIWLNYLIIGVLTLPIHLIFYFFYPPKKIKKLSITFRYNLYKNIFFITVFIILFILLFIKFRDHPSASTSVSLVSTV